jgi:hypothetical protein
MSTVVAAGRRYLPRGWGDLGRQLAIWFGFAVAYQLARGIADRNPSKALANGQAVVDFEEHVTHRLYELTFQNFVDQRHLLATAVGWTYWLSEFAVVGLAVLFVYMRRHDAFIGFRNSILLANVIGLVGYILVPTAPPRLLAVGFVNDHRDGLVNLAANPYAWPAWVWFAVMATGNHFWLDCLAGVGVAILAMAIVYNRRARTVFAAHRA